MDWYGIHRTFYTDRVDDKRFWLKVEMTQHCWLWTGARVVSTTTRATYAYGILVRNGQRWLAHRYSLFLANGRLPRDALVLHSCDVGLCVRPEHLRTGSQKDNIREASARGRLANRHYRGVKGSANKKARLTDDQVLAIRARWASGVRPMRVLADEFGVSRQTVEKIVHRKRWSHL